MEMTSSAPRKASKSRNASTPWWALLLPSCVTFNKYKRWGGGITSTRPVACAKTANVSKAMRMLFQPPASGSKVKYFRDGP